MTIADIHGKLSGASQSDRSEDLLTSNVFGCLRYLPPEEALIPFLNTANSLAGRSFSIADGVVKTHFSFWPWLHARGFSACEPDVVLGLEREDSLDMVMVEVKYLSGPSSEEDTESLPHHQLARELDQLSCLSSSRLGWRTHAEPTSRALLYVTRDLGMPRVDMERAALEYLSKRKRSCDIYWTSWCFLPALLETAFSGESMAERQAVLEDMISLLERKWLIPFLGIDRVTFADPTPEFYQELSYLYKWPEWGYSLPSYSFKSPSGVYEWPEPNVADTFTFGQMPASYDWPAISCPLTPYLYERRHNG